ncbi:hypothetical protein FBY06_11569 [Pseudomonas sp. SJZ085]|nr:hypothetical protein FBX99_11569 [Pseudomonas sp. SJZ074]TWC36116.1 hypothetical protein FBY06_11569 [Pseudomonas sp. SJZ085]
MTEAQTDTAVKCVRCRQPVEKPIYRNIIDQAFDPVRRKKYVRTQNLPFCSEEHYSHEQMSREG